MIRARSHPVAAAVAAAAAAVLIPPVAFAAAGPYDVRTVGAPAGRMPPYRGLAVDRIPAGRIQHVVFETTTTTTKDGQPPPPEENELNLTQRFETWNSRAGGRAVATLVAGRFLSDGDRAEIPIGGVIEEYTVSGRSCQRWQPATNVITRWTCKGVNDRNTALLEHNETGLAHNYRHRSLSPYEIAALRSGGRPILRFRIAYKRDDDARGDAGAPPGAPRITSAETVRTARVRRRNFHLLTDETRSRQVIDGHVYVRVTTTRVMARELLPDTPANRVRMRMRRPGATVRRGKPTFERPR